MDGCRKYNFYGAIWMYHKLTDDQKDRLVDSIIENDGLLVGYMEFTAIYFEITENIAGFELMTQSEYDELLDHLWNLYEKKRNDYHLEPGMMFKDL